MEPGLISISMARERQRGEKTSRVEGGLSVRLSLVPTTNTQQPPPPPFLLGWANKDTKQNGGRWSHLERGAMRWGLSVKLLGRPWISSVVAWPRTPLRSFRQLPRTKTAAVLNSSTSKACARRTVTAHWSISIQTAPPSPRPPFSTCLRHSSSANEH